MTQVIGWDNHTYELTDYKKVSILIQKGIVCEHTFLEKTIHPLIDSMLAFNKKIKSIYIKTQDDTNNIDSIRIVFKRKTID